MGHPAGRLTTPEIYHSMIFTFTFNLFISISASVENDKSTGGLKMTFNPLFTAGSRDPSAESVTSLISTSTGNSISPQGTTQRPHSITSKNNDIIYGEEIR